MEVLQRTANRGSVSTGPYQIDNSVKMEADNTEYLSRVLSSTGNRRTFTISTWRKRTELGDMQTMYSCNVSGQEGTLLRFATENANYPDAIQIDIGAVGTNSRSYTSASFRDTSAWYHVVLAVDTTQSTATDRFKLYVNGVLITDYASRNNPAQNFDTSNNHADNSNTQHVGAYTTGGQVYGKTSGYTADTYHIDGQALAPTEFGEFDSDTGIWIPKAYTGSYGTNGFFLDFADASDLGDDESGNGNDFTETNITAADQSTDTPTNSFCTLNNVFIGSYFHAATDGGTHVAMDGVNQYASCAGTIGVTKGKWYFETYIDTRSSTYGLTTWLGYHTFQGNYHANNYWNTTNQNSVALYYPHGGQYYTWSGGSRSVTSGLGSIGASGVGKYIGYALNLDDNQITFYYDGSAITNGSNLALNDLGTETDNGIFAIPAFSIYDNDVTVNFGGFTKATISSAQSDENGYGTFEHAPPSGYYALCTKNLAEFG